EPDEPGQQVRGAHVRAGEPDLREQERERGGARQQAEVAGEGDHRAGAGGDPVDRRDHGQGALAQPLRDRARHARELEQPAGVELQKLADDLVDVAARAEADTPAGDDQHAHVVPLRQLAEQVAQVGVPLERQRVQPLGPVERQRRHALLDGEAEVPPALGDAGRCSERAHVWIPPPSSTRVCPLMAAALSEARKATAAATSSGSSSRPSGDEPTSAASAWSSSLPVASTMRAIARSVSSVRTNVGHTPFAGTPVPASSAATARMRPTAACFEAVYEQVYGTPILAAVEATVTIRPLPRSTIPGSAARVKRKAPVAFTLRCDCQDSSVVRASGALSA